MGKKSRTTNETFLSIDLDRLDEHWVEQPELFKEYHDELSDAKKDLAICDAALDVIKSEIARDIRRDPTEFGIEKITEPAIKEMIPLQKKYKKQLAELIDAQHRVDVLSGTVKALDHRKKALENAVYLHGQNYFSTPRASGEGGRKMREVEKRATRKSISRDELEREDDD